VPFLFLFIFHLSTLCASGGYLHGSFWGSRGPPLLSFKYALNRNEASSFGLAHTMDFLLHDTKDSKSTMHLGLGLRSNGFLEKCKYFPIVMINPKVVANEVLYFFEHALICMFMGI